MPCLFRHSRLLLPSPSKVQALATTLLSKVSKLGIVLRRIAASARRRRLVAGLEQLRPVDERWECENSLYTFVRHAWHHAGEPTKFIPNWHLELICEQLEAVSRKEVLRLLINVPPRHGKSLIANVFYPAWVWAQQTPPDLAIAPDSWRGPGVRFMHVTYKDDLSTHHSVQCRQPLTWPSGLFVPSRPGEFHPEPLTDPDLTLSRHPARAIARRLLPSIEHRVPPVAG